MDFDYAGNVYITGGGDGSVHKLAKFNAAGILQWTFSGSLTIPSWTFGTYYGGWVVEKTTGNVYLGQGFAPSGGHRIIRINTTGIYDNYITAANASFLENWKMYWRCNSGVAQLLVAGGGTNSNNNFALCSPPSTVISPLNVTGIPYSGGGWAQDISDLVIDPLTNSLYTIYGSLYGTPSLSNKIYKNNAPYSGASVAWNVPSGFIAIQEIANRPYMSSTQMDNSSNVLAINSSYLFYWDGKNLKAFDKATGTGVGTPLTVAANVQLMSGGIIADECNNIFVGSTNGTIKVYKFVGGIFNDAINPDITIPGFSSSSVYDLAFYESQKILYASGNGFVSSFDVASYGCVSNVFSLNVSSACATLSATITVSPVPPAGSTVTYVLMNGATQVASNTNGVFAGLSPNINYTVNATVNLICSGVATSTSFVLPGAAISTATANSTCGNSNGTITITASCGTAPFSYNNNGGEFKPVNTCTGLPAGNYTVGVTDANGCSSTALINITNTNGPTATYTKTDATCGSNTGTITATGTGGTAPLSYSINGSTFQTSNIFNGILPGTYTLTVKDATGCINVSSITINNSSGPSISAIPTTTYCNTNNGIITAIAAGGTAPLQYSLNANTYQASNIFNNLFSGSYTVTVKDANGCLSNVSVTVPNSPAPTVTATATTASCNNANASITANGSGGTLPLQYSINGVTFQASNFFAGLTPGIYVVSVKDFNNCINTVSVTVNSTSGPQVTATTAASSCGLNTGSITAAGSGGAGALQYSINGINFQVSTLFSGIAAGTYTLMVRDGNGCLGAAIVVVANTAAPTVTASVTPTACSSSNGIITASGSGGTAPLTYSINGTTFQASNIFNSLATGPYAVTVKDVNGCTSATSVVMTNVANLSITASTLSSSCSSSSGSITANGLGGAAPLQYSINGVTYQASSVFNGIAGGNYTVYVKDANGCISTVTVTVGTALAAVISATATNATCTGSNAVITVTASGGVAPLQYSINGVTYQANNIFINIGSGVYTVYVKDATNCIQTTSVTITNVGSGPGISTLTVKASGTYPCNFALGKIDEPLVNGGNCGTCTFSLNFGAFVPNTSPLFSNLNQGTYYVTAMNTNGCSKTIIATIGSGVLSTASAVVTGTPCNTSNGSIALTGIGPKTPYHASISGIGGPWITFDPTYTFIGLAPGIYDVIMADDESFDIGPPIIPGGCLDTVTFIVPATGGPSLSISKSNGTCQLNDGTITAFGSGGVPPLLFSINGGGFQPSGLFTNLSSGVYVIDVMDDNGCMNTKIDTIVNPSGPAVTAVAGATTCLTANGTITATASGGTTPYLYSINGTVFQNTGIFTGLAAGTYTVTVGDASLCYKTTTAIITNTPRPTVTGLTIAATCNGSNGMVIANGASGTVPYQYSINGTTFQSSNTFTGLAAGFYTITIKDANGCLNSTGVQISDLLAPTLTLASTAATCANANGTITATGLGGIAPLQYSSNGTIFQASNIFSGLTAGPYTIIVVDANGCQTSKNILITSPNVPQTLTGSIVNASCGNSNGTITAAATGGIAPLTYSINGTVFQASTLFSALPASTYPLTVKDVNGCTKVLNVTVANLPGPTVSAASTLSSCFANDGTITANALGGTGAITYSKNGVLFQASNVFTGLTPGNYTITAKDIKNCISTTNVLVGQVVAPVISALDSTSVCGNNIVVTGTGGASPYQYTLNNGTFQNSNIFTCQLQGTYLLTIIDANGCRDTITLTLANPLPIELLYFNGKRNHEVVDLKWVTETEINNDYFTVERSDDGTHFSKLMNVDGAGNSTSPLSYFAKDEHPLTGNSYYRLKQTDYNGSTTLSKIIKINFSSDNSCQLYPNPVKNNLTISSGEKIAKLVIYDVAGRQLTEYSGYKDVMVKVDLSNLAEGYYTLKVYDEYGMASVHNFIKEGE
ncbi:MAG: T9SS type A sorting domain-containing protein [Bacteroidetes bacterium]|nr:T9SS type A sorting domain-containing protein [Bacteroidota bacterium]